MSDTLVRGEAAIEASGARAADMRLEVVVIPVSDVDRAAEFYGGLGWRLDAYKPLALVCHAAAALYPAPPAVRPGTPCRRRGR